MEITQIQLERIKFSAVRALPPGMDPDTLDVVVNNIGESLAVRLTAHLASERLRELSVKYPADWWEAVKERFAPEWFKKRYPVKYTHTVLEARAVYPLISLPKEHNLVILTTTKGRATSGLGGSRHDRMADRNR